MIHHRVLVIISVILLLSGCLSGKKDLPIEVEKLSCKLTPEKEACRFDCLLTYRNTGSEDLSTFFSYICP